MDIRLAARADIDAVAAVIAEFRDWLSKEDPPTETIRESVQKIIDGGDGAYLIAARAGEVAGVCQLRFRWSVWTSAEDCWLEDLYVRDPARRSGVGRRLVEAAIARAEARGCKRIELDVNEQNEAALALYEACGFSAEPKPPGRTFFLSRRLSPQHGRSS